MKLLTFMLDDLASRQDYAGMLSLVARHFDVPPPEDFQLDISSRGPWKWQSIILYGGYRGVDYWRDGTYQKTNFNYKINMAVIRGSSCYSFLLPASMCS